jgi:hypothetical protein
MVSVRAALEADFADFFAVTVAMDLLPGVKPRS